MSNTRTPIPSAQRAKLLVCVNDSAHSRVAIRFACGKARQSGCPVEFLTVISPVDFQTFGTVADKMRTEKWQDAENLLQRLAEEVQDYARIIPSLSVREGRIEEEIISAVQEDASINMLILGISPHTPGKDALIPQLASKLGNELLIPMLIVPGNLTEQQIHELT
ncbi:MAG: universal stress family protein [Rickettsiales bacterium]|nr:universal stress family protein [Rickettsiales bacterium]